MMLLNTFRSYCRNLYSAPNLLKHRHVVTPSSSRYVNSSNSSAYDGPGKTTVEVLQKSNKEVNLINTYSASGFRLANEMFVRGSILVFPTHVYSWRVKRGIDITPESLLIFDLVVPKIKILVIGYGSRDDQYDISISNHLRKRGISCEILPTPNAVTTYNYLVVDGVPVAGAFIPVRVDVSPSTKDYQAVVGDKLIHEDNSTRVRTEDMIDTQMRYLHEVDKEGKKFGD